MAFVNINNSFRGGDDEYKRVVDKIEKDGVCPFCPGHLVYHKNSILAEGDFWLVTDNSFPYKGAKHHILFIHKEHIENIKDLSNDAWSELFDMVKSETKKRGIEGGTFFIRFGNTSYTGATVSHLHANIVSPDADNPNREPIIARVG